MNPPEAVAPGTTRPAPPLDWRDAAVAIALYAATFALLVRVARGLGLVEGEGAALSDALAAASPLSFLHATDRLTELRVPTISVSALLPVATYLLLRAELAWPMAVGGAALGLLAPRAAPELVAVNGDGVAAALVGVSIAAYLWASRTRAKVVWSIVSAAALGFAASRTMAALVVLPIVMVDHALSHPSRVERSSPEGKMPVPLVVALAPIVATAAFLLVHRTVLTAPFERLRDLLVIAGSPEIARGTWLGEAPMPDTIPRFHAAAMLLLALPSATSVLALVGVFHAARSRRRLGATSLALVAVVVLLGYPLVVPPALGRFPGRFAMALPFVAVLATWGATLCGQALSRWVRETWSPLAFAVVVAGASFVPTPASLSACFPLLAGGAARARTGATVPFVDGTEVGGLLAAIDALGLDDATIYAPAVPVDTWELYRRLGRLRTRLRPVGSRPLAKLSIDDGRTQSPANKPVATLRRDGAVVASLYVHSPAL